MNWKIRYAAQCIKGAVRRNNQDNLLLGSFYLPEQNSAMDHCRSGSADTKDGFVLAVFDGIGGAPHGEAAAYIAAKSMSEGIKPLYFPGEKKMAEQVAGTLLSVNESALRYRDQRKITDYGSTVAGVWFDKRAAASFNIGDSRVYVYRDGQMELVSRDHTVARGVLAQYIGMDEREGILEPDISVMDLQHGMQFLICSDGLTSCMTDAEIQGFFEKEIGGEELINSMMRLVIRRGSPDNATIIWCEAV